MNDFGQHGSGDGKSRFEELLTGRFPAIADETSEIERGLLHLEMGVFARATRAAIEQHDFEEITAHFSFIDGLLRDAAPDVKNVIYFSYLENVFLGRDEERYHSARAALSDSLGAALIELEEYFRDIADLKRQGSPTP